MISDNTQAKPLDKTAVSRSCGNIKFTKNTEQTRIWLKAKGFEGLSFFQGKTYIYAFLTTRANAFKEWKEKDYSTFDLEDISFMTYLDKEVDFNEFKEYIESLT